MIRNFWGKYDANELPKSAREISRPWNATGDTETEPSSKHSLPISTCYFLNYFVIVVLLIQNTPLSKSKQSNGGLFSNEVTPYYEWLY